MTSSATRTARQQPKGVMAEAPPPPPPASLWPILGPEVSPAYAAARRASNGGGTGIVSEAAAAASMLPQIPGLGATARRQRGTSLSGGPLPSSPAGGPSALPGLLGATAGDLVPASRRSFSGAPSATGSTSTPRSLLTGYGRLPSNPSMTSDSASNGQTAEAMMLVAEASDPGFSQSPPLAPPPLAAQSSVGSFSRLSMTDIPPTMRSRRCERFPYPNSDPYLYPKPDPDPDPIQIVSKISSMGISSIGAFQSRGLFHLQGRPPCSPSPCLRAVASLPSRPQRPSRLGLSFAGSRLQRPLPGVDTAGV